MVLTVLRCWTTQYCFDAKLLRLICEFNEISISILELTNQFSNTKCNAKGQEH